VNPVALHHAVDGPETGPPVGPPLVLGGSMGTSLEMWRPQLPSLAARHRVVRYDHRGHGGSPVPPGPYTLDDLGGDVLRLLDTFGVSTVDYAGLSLGGMWFTPAFPPERREPYRAMLAGTPAEGYAGCCEAIAGMDLRPALSEITAPTLVVAAADDPAIPPRYAEQIAEAVTGSRLVVLDYAAHLASVEQAGTVDRLLLDWFGDRKGGSG
jgi:3-oxoadipate enol-lactonase